MTITVWDCLKLPALREAKVIGGQGGLDQFVSTVSVLEYAKIYAMAEELFLGNELILTAFASIKDSVEEQCTALCRLHEVGEAGVILYYVGYFVAEVDQRLIDTANELNFPLIVMPLNAYYSRYSEVITEVLQAIFEDQKKESYYVRGILEQIARMRERQRTMESVLRLLSDRLRCSFLLVDREGKDEAFASWPTASKSIFDHMLQYLQGNKESGRNIVIQKSEVTTNSNMYSQRFDTQYQKSLQLLALDEGNLLNEDSFQQAIEVIQMFSSIWKYDFKVEDTDALVRAILNDYPLGMKRIAEKFHLELSEIRVMWVVKPYQKEQMVDKEETVDVRNFVSVLKKYLREHGKTVVVDTFDDGIVAFMNEETFLEMDIAIAESFVRNVAGADWALIWCGAMDSAQEVRKTYMLIENCFETICQLYPRKRIFTARELRFARECLAILEQGEIATQQCEQVLQLLMGQKDTLDLLDTLSVYLVDANKSVSVTANILFIHESTVKYRLNKIRQRLGYEIDQMPGAYNLYLAVALRRII